MHSADRADGPASPSLPEVEAPRRPEPAALWLKAVSFAVAFFACAELGWYLSAHNFTFVSFWVPAGLSVAVLLLNENRAWPWLLLAIFPANLAFDLRHGTPFATFLGFYGVNAIQAATGAWLVRRFVAKWPTLATLREFFGLIGCSAVLSTMLGAALGTAILIATGVSHSFTASWTVWWGSEAMAILLVAPFVLTWFAPARPEYRQLKQPLRLVEAAVLVAGLVWSTWYLLVLDEGILVPYKSRLLLFVIWAGLRFGARGAATANLLLAVLMAFFTNHFLKGLSPAQISSGSYITVMQSFLAMSALVGLIPAIMVGERDRTLAQLRESESRLRNLTAAAFEGVFITENGRVVDVNNQGLKLFGYERDEMIGRAVIDFVSPETRAIVAAAIQAGREVAYEHRLIRKDGSIFEAEAQAKMLRVGDRTVRMTAIRDITERKAAEEALRESQARLVLAMDMAKIAYWEFDVATGCFTFNENFYRLLRTTAAQEGGMLLAAADYARKFIPPEEAAIVAGEIAEAVATTDPAYTRQLAHRVIRADGSTGMMLVRFAIIKDAAGRTIKTYGANQDVTDSRKTEQALAAGEALLRQFIRHAPAAIAMLDHRMCYLQASDRWLQDYHLAAHNIIGRSHYEVFPDIPERWKDIHRRVLAGAVERCEEDPFPRADGALEWLRWEMRPWREPSGTIGGVIMFTQVITERKRIEAALEQQRLRMESIVNSASDGIITVDEGQRVVVFNPAAEHMFRCPAANAVGEPLSRFIPERSRAHLAEHLRQFGWAGVTTRAMGKFGPIGGLRADGEEFPIEATISQSLLGQQRLLTLTCRDMTDRVKAEVAKRRMEAQLLQAQKLEAIGTLAGGIAHDFNNILTGIMGNLQLAEMDLPDDHPVRPLLGQAVGASRRARDLVSQILTFSQQRETRRAPEQLGPIVEEALRLLRATLPTTIVIRSDLAADCPPVLCDASQMHQVIMNLGVNAAAAMRERGGLLEVKLERRDPEPALLAKHPQVEARQTIRLAVSDTGCGMSAAVLERIFEPFFTTKPPGEGTGLGLAMVHGIMQTHGGALVVESAPGGGSTFLLFFPEASPAAPGNPDGGLAGVAAQAPGRAGEGERILVVDDEQSVLDVLALALKRQGFEPESHLRAAEALAAFERAPAAYAAVVTDLTMPEMTGLDLARRILALHPALPVILTSGHMHEEAKEEARRAGVVHFFTKPYELSDVVATVRAVLQSLPGR